MSEDLPYVVGSRDLIQATLYDDVAGIRTPINLVGATVTLRAQVGRGAVKTWSADADPDQVNYPGRCSYELGAIDLDRSGPLRIQGVVVVGGKTYRSQPIERVVLPAL